MLFTEVESDHVPAAPAYSPLREVSTPSGPRRLAAPRKLPAIERCRYCGQGMSREMIREGKRVPWNKATRHHVLAQRFGGSDEESNLRWCCLRCNQNLAVIDECPGALAAATSILRSTGHTVNRANVKEACLPLGFRRLRP